MITGNIQRFARFGRLSFMAYRALYTWSSPLDFVIIKILEPTAQICFFTLLGTFAGYDPAYFALGNAVRLASVSGLYGCVLMMIEERFNGTLQIVIATSTPIAQTLFTRVILQGVIGLFTSIFGLSIGTLLFGLDFSHVHWGWLLLALLLTAYAIASFGFFVSIFGVTGVDLTFAMNLAYTLLILLCGVNFPITALPLPLQLLGNLLPLTHGLTAIRAIFAGELLHVPVQLAIEAGIGVLYASAGYLLFRVAEYRARVWGTLDLV